MANVTAKTSSNIFYKARCEAATHNEQLSSREGAADYMSIDRGRLYRIESGIAVPYPEEIRLMADLYNAPELENYFCRTMCPLGCEMPKAELANLDRITVRTLSVFRKIGKTKSEMITLLARSKRGEQPKQFGFMCRDCFKEFCKGLGLDIPELIGLAESVTIGPGDEDE